MTNLNEMFVNELARMKDPVQVLGITKILGVKSTEVIKDADGEVKEVKARDASEIIIDMIDAFALCSRSRKRELLKMMRAANKGGVNDLE